MSVCTAVLRNTHTHTHTYTMYYEWSFFLHVEIPGPPRFLRSKDYPDDERAVSLSWQHPASISLTSEVEKYLVELSFDERGFVKVRRLRTIMG